MTSIFDVFSTGPATAAANTQAEAIKNALAAGNTYFGAGENSVTGNTNTGLGTISNFTNLGAGGLGNYVNTGANALNNYVSSALGPSYSNFYGVGQPGTTALGNALGLNGPAGNAAATQSFWNNPAIQSQLNIGSNNIMRQAAASGGGNLSGSTLAALQKYGQDVASGGWNNYVSSLNPYLNFSQGTAGNIGTIGAGAGNTAANLFGNAGSTFGNLFSTAGGQSAGLLGNSSNNLANLYSQQGGMNYGGLTSAGNAYANADLANYGASSNMLGALLGGGKLLGGSAGLAGGLGSLASGIGGGIGSAASGIGGGIASALGGAGDLLGGLALFSDERVKEDVKKVGELFDGQPIYRYRYKGSPRMNIGLIAQDVEREHPDAVSEFSGIKMVDYRRATERAAFFADYAKRAHEMRMAA